MRLQRDPEASDHLAQASELAQAFGDRALQSEAARLGAEVYLQLGDLRAARNEARRALELAEKVGSRTYAGMAHRVLGTILAKGGITDEDKQQADFTCRSRSRSSATSATSSSSAARTRATPICCTSAATPTARPRSTSAPTEITRAARAQGHDAALVRRQAADAHARSVAMALPVPDDVVELCRRLRAAGFEAWLVGGAVAICSAARRRRTSTSPTSAQPAEASARVRPQAHDPDRREARDRDGVDRARGEGARRGHDLSRRRRVLRRPAADEVSSCVARRGSRSGATSP